MASTRLGEFTLPTTTLIRTTLLKLSSEPEPYNLCVGFGGLSDREVFALVKYARKLETVRDDLDSAEVTPEGGRFDGLDLD